MNGTAIINLVCAVVAISAAVLNGWIGWLRPSERAHLWLALAALGAGGVGIGIVFLYGAETPAETLLGQRFAMGAAALLIGAFPRFACALLGVQRPDLARAGLALAAASLLFAIVPALALATSARLRALESPTGELGTSLASIVALGFFAALGVFFWQILLLFLRHRARMGREAPFLVSMTVLWLLAGFNDMAVGAGLYQGPLVVTAGYACFLMGFSAILVRRMSSSMTLHEKIARQLNGLVEERTEELRERELQLARGEKMATTGILAAGVAREIGDPISLVTTQLERLQRLRTLPGKLDEVQSVLQACRDGVDRIHGIVSGLLSMATDGALPRDSVDLREIVASTLPMLRGELRDRCSLIEALESVPPVVGSPRELGQVVMNLVESAARSIPPGDAACHFVRVETRHRDGSVELVVTDSGPALPDAHSDRVFDPFFDRGAGSGTDLGLPISQQLVQRHRGRIEVEAGPEGTRVVVSLPVAAARTATTSVPER